MRTVIYHRADFDGLFSGAVCKKFMPGAELIGWDFGDPLIEFPKEGDVYVVDLSPDCLASLPFDAEKRLVWIDHHKSSISKWDDSLGNPFRGYRIDGVAACRLCWAWFLEAQSGKNESAFTLPIKDEFAQRSVSEPDALMLAGEYDVWDLHDGRAIPLQFGLIAMGCDSPEAVLPFINTYWLSNVGQYGNIETMKAIGRGRDAMAWQESFASQVCRERSYVRTWEGRVFCILGSPHARNSMWFPEKAIPFGCDALMCWRYDGERVSFSLYHAPGHEDADLSLIAVKYGGGGHKGACGFSMTLSEALEVIA